MYKLAKYNGFIIRMNDGAFIPNDPRNNDYSDYLEWVRKGNNPQPYIDEKEVEQARLDAEQAELNRLNAEKLAKQQKEEIIASLAAAKEKNDREFEQAKLDALSAQEKELLKFVPVDMDISNPDIKLLAEIRLNRFNEYPSVLDCIEAIMENMEGRPEKMLMVQSKREYVRNKYPKPLSMLAKGL